MNMADQQLFSQTIKQGYHFEEGPFITLGGAMLDGEPMPDHHIRAPLSMFTRHGMISGATGTGKTKSLQVIAEQLSKAGVPSLLMDIKGDLSGLAQPGSPHPKIDERHTAIGSLPYEPKSFPVELLSLSNEPGVRLRATVTEFGPELFSRMLNLTSSQEGVIAVAFKYCDDNSIPMVGLEDLKKILQYMQSEGKEEIKQKYGMLSMQSIGAIQRKLIELETQGANLFFGEPSFDIDDLLGVGPDGNAKISIVRLTDIQDRPKLFSTFMIQMLAEIYNFFPEAGDVEQPKLVMFIDEAHLVFEKASDVLLDQIEVMIKLIRSKGVGVFFITQNPVDVPAEVLGQLGMKVQHALRAFTARDRKAIKLAAENFPLTTFYDVDKLLNELGTGEALISVLNEDGIPTPLVHTMMRAPQSRMDILNQAEINALIEQSRLVKKYEQPLNRESAKEILEKKIAFAQQEAHRKQMKKEQEKASQTRSRSKKPDSIIEQILDSRATREFSRTVGRELTRGLLSVLGVKGKR